MSCKQSALTNFREVRGASLLDEIVVARSESSQERPDTPPGPKVGILQILDHGGTPFVLLAMGEEPLAARSTVALKPSYVGRRVLLLFENNDLREPIVIGVLGGPDESAAESAPPVDVTIDGSRLTLKAERELVLQCGEASITLTCTGKVVIRGKALVSRSSGVNRIKGASVQIN